MRLSPSVLDMYWIIFKEQICLFNSVWMIRLLLKNTVSQRLAGSEEWKGRWRTVLRGGIQSLMKRLLYMTPKASLDNQNIAGTWAVSAQPRVWPVSLRGLQGMETSQPPTAHSGVQNWFLFKDDNDKVPLGLSKLLGWSGAVFPVLASR